MGEQTRRSRASEKKGKNASPFELTGHDIMRCFFSVFPPASEEANSAGTACANMTTFRTSERDYEVCQMV